MKIRMTVSISGTAFTLGAGEETDRFSEAEARRLIEEGSAELVVDEAPAAPRAEAVAQPAAAKRKARLIDRVASAVGLAETR